MASGSTQTEYYFYRHLDYQLYGGALWVACAAPKPKNPSTPTEQADTTAYVAPCVRNAVRHLAAATVSQATLKACVLSTPAPPESGSPQIGWVSPVEYSHSPHTIVEPLAWINTLLVGFTTYETFRPSITTTNSAITVYPSSSPIPRNGELGSVTTGNSNTSNPASSFSTLLGALYAQNFSYSNNAASLPIADQQSIDAANGVISNIVADMNCHLQASPGPTSAPVKSFPSYSFGNVSYPRHNANGHTAPFCAP